MIKTRFNENFIFYLLLAGISSYLLSLFLLQLFFGVLSVLWIAEKISEKKKAVTFFTILILIFGGVRLLSIAFSLHPDSSIQSLYKDALFYFSFFALSFYLKALPLEKVTKAAYVFALAALLMSLIGLILFNLKVVARTATFTTGYATFSSYIVTALGFQLVLPYSKDKKYNWILWAVGIAVMLSALITSMGRTNIALAGLLIIAALFLKKFSIKSALVVFLLTALISILSFQNNAAEIKDRVENPTALSDRDILYNAAKYLSLKRPVLGFGPRTFHDIFPYRNQLTDKGVGSWHNDFIQVYFESGLLGLLSFLLIIFVVWYYNILFLRRINDDNLANIGQAILLGFTALILSAVTAGFIDSPVLSIVFAFLIALLSSVIYHSSAFNISLIKKQN
ncbi:MAG: hypothetical protein K8H86_00675 [Ignavibacteriaceae bacterium]|nr:hypothetical protein [Ignavibacteriaceae bacterium]